MPQANKIGSRKIVPWKKFARDCYKIILFSSSINIITIIFIIDAQCIYLYNILSSIYIVAFTWLQLTVGIKVNVSLFLSFLVKLGKYNFYFIYINICNISFYIYIYIFFLDQFWTFWFF